MPATAVSIMGMAAPTPRDFRASLVPFAEMAVSRNPAPPRDAG